MILAMSQLACPAARPLAVPGPVAAPLADSEWVDGAVGEALVWEIMPGTTGDEDDGHRAAELRSFFLAHPEYRDPARRVILSRHACGLGGTEAAHRYLSGPPPRETLVIDVTVDDWRLLVVHADDYCTSDDWTYYSNDAQQAGIALGAATEYAGPDVVDVAVRRGGVEQSRLPVTGQGYLMVRAGQDPLDLEYSPTFKDDMEQYFERDLPDGWVAPR